MKRFLLLIFLPILLIAKDVVEEKLDDINMYNDIFIAADKDVKINVNKIALSKKYKELHLKEVSSEGSLDAISNLQKSNANIAIARGDILGFKNSAMFKLEGYLDYGIICSPSRSLLYLVSKTDITSINDLRGQRVSVGLASNMGQIYLDDVSKNGGIHLDISYSALSLDDSINALLKDEIDVIFMFGPSKYMDNFGRMGLSIQSIPDDFFKNLTIKKGLHPHTYMLKDKRIRTYEVPNFIIAPTKTLDDNLSFKIEAMVSAFKCYKSIQNIDSFYGEIHPNVKGAVGNIHKRIAKEGAITFKFKNEVKSDDDTKYFYYINNNSKSDINVTFEQFKTKSFDEIPIKPRHLISIVPKGELTIKAKSQKLITFIYKNPFLYRIKKRKIEAIFKNMTIKDEYPHLSLTIGDDQ